MNQFFFLGEYYHSHYYWNVLRPNFRIHNYPLYNFLRREENFPSGKMNTLLRLADGEYRQFPCDD